MAIETSSWKMQLIFFTILSKIRLIVAPRVRIIHGRSIDENLLKLHCIAPFSVCSVIY